MISGLYIRTDGKLVIESIETQERDGLTGTGYQKTYLGREICTRVLEPEEGSPIIRHGVIALAVGAL